MSIGPRSIPIPGRVSKFPNIYRASSTFTASNPPPLGYTPEEDIPFDPPTTTVSSAPTAGLPVYTPDQVNTVWLGDLQNNINVEGVALITARKITFVATGFVGTNPLYNSSRVIDPTVPAFANMVNLETNTARILLKSAFTLSYETQRYELNWDSGSSNWSVAMAYPTKYTTQLDKLPESNLTPDSSSPNPSLSFQHVFDYTGTPSPINSNFATNADYADVSVWDTSFDVTQPTQGVLPELFILKGRDNIEEDGRWIVDTYNNFLNGLETTRLSSLSNKLGQTVIGGKLDISTEEVSFSDELRRVIEGEIRIPNNYEEAQTNAGRRVIQSDGLNVYTWPNDDTAESWLVNANFFNNLVNTKKTTRYSQPWTYNISTKSSSRFELIPGYVPPATLDSGGFIVQQKVESWIGFVKKDFLGIDIEYSLNVIAPIRENAPSLPNPFYGIATIGPTPIYAYYQNVIGGSDIHVVSATNGGLLDPKWGSNPWDGGRRTSVQEFELTTTPSSFTKVFVTQPLCIRVTNSTSPDSIDEIGLDVPDSIKPGMYPVFISNEIPTATLIAVNVVAGRGTLSNNAPPGSFQIGSGMTEFYYISVLNGPSGVQYRVGVI